jgi:hypothetical protein
VLIRSRGIVGKGRCLIIELGFITLGVNKSFPLNVDALLCNVPGPGRSEVDRSVIEDG